MPIPDHAIRTADVDGFRVVFAHQEEFDNLCREIFGDGAYRFDCRRAAPRIVDCGAHIGLSVLYFKRRWPRAQITAFEPSPDTFALLERNLGSNGLADVELVNAAITASGDATSFYVPRDPLFWHWGDAGPVGTTPSTTGRSRCLPCDSRRTSAGPWTSSSSISKGSKPPCSARRTPPGDWHVSDPLSHAAMNSVPENQRSAGRGCRIFESLSAAFHRESESTQVGIASAYQGLTI